VQTLGNNKFLHAATTALMQWNQANLSPSNYSEKWHRKIETTVNCVKLKSNQKNMFFCKQNLSHFYKPHTPSHQNHCWIKPLALNINSNTLFWGKGSAELNSRPLVTSQAVCRSNDSLVCTGLVAIGNANFNWKFALPISHQYFLQADDNQTALSSKFQSRLNAMPKHITHSR